MTYYLQEITRIKNSCYSNEGQLDVVIGTRHYITQNYNQALNLDKLSHARFTSKFHLLRLYKRYYGQTPKKYLVDLRLTASKKSLATGCSIMQTCFDVGFESPSAFSTLFKSRFGLAPVEFQKKSNFYKVR